MPICLAEFGGAIIGVMLGYFLDEITLQKHGKLSQMSYIESKHLKVWVWQFVLYVIGISMPSLHTEYTDSNIVSKWKHLFS